MLLDDLCSDMGNLAQEQGLFLKARGPDSLPVEGDPVKLRRIAQNLLLNALRYTAHGGVRISWGQVHGGTIPRWLLCVQDTGPGFDDGEVPPIAHALKEATDQIHEEEGNADIGSVANPAPTLASGSPERAEHPPHGEGVGLAIVKRLCDMLDANIELETEPGKGSTFRLTFPLHYSTD